MTDPKAIQALADAVVAAHDPWARLARAVHAAWTGPAAPAGGEEIQIHAKREPGGGARLRMTAGGKTIEAELSSAERLSLIRYLTTAQG